MQKIYCYVDESGQDTKGAYFIVVVVILDQHSVNEVETMLGKIEQETGKMKRNRPRKWTDTRLKEKVAYLKRILQIPQLEGAIFYVSFRDTKDYTALTTRSIAHAILARTTKDYKAYIMIDGLNEKERGRVSKGLYQRGIRRRKLRGGRDESTSLLRLADSMAGFIRDYEEGKLYTQELYPRFSHQQIITRLKT